MGTNGGSRKNGKKREIAKLRREYWRVHKKLVVQLGLMEGFLEVDDWYEWMCCDAKIRALGYSIVKVVQQMEVLGG